MPNNSVEKEENSKELKFRSLVWPSVGLKGLCLDDMRQGAECCTTGRFSPNLLTIVGTLIIKKVVGNLMGNVMCI
jgi:hypothetical protein